jgi:hypothetical protein
MPDDRQMIDYLLGRLSAAEAERLDEASIADDEFAARLRVCETDLVDSYVVGALDAEALKHFESHYLSSPLRRKNVRFASGFLLAVHRAALQDETAAHTSPTVVTGDGATRRGLTWPLRITVAAALTLVVGGSVLFQVVRQRNGRGLDPGSRVVSTDRAPAEPSAMAPAPGEERSGQPDAGAPQAAQSGPLATLVLMPQSREVTAVPSVTLAPDTDHVAFELRLESNDFRRYEVGLTDPASNEVIWRSGPVVGTSGAAPAVLVLVPARVLMPQHYSFAVTGLHGREAEVVGSYSFKVLRR